jgi:uncharacterized protein YlxP (DUF503 family)
MHILLLTVELSLPVSSLKGKRGIVKSLLSRARHHFNVASAEVDRQDDAGWAVLAFTTVSCSAVRARQLLESLEEWIPSERPEAEIIISDIVEL